MWSLVFRPLKPLTVDHMETGLDSGVTEMQCVRVNMSPRLASLTLAEGMFLQGKFLMTFFQFFFSCFFFFSFLNRTILMNIIEQYYVLRLNHIHQIRALEFRVIELR